MIAQTIQLALTPVFVLVAIASILNLLTARLARVVDRSRLLQTSHGETSGDDHDRIVAEMRIIARRINLIGQAMLMLVLSGLTIGLTVVLLFVAEISGTDIPLVAAAVFITAIALLMAGLVLTLRETREASNALRIPDMFLELDRNI